MPTARVAPLETYGWALRCCARNWHRAEEVVQATYLKILQGKARFAAGSTFKTWLFAVIRRTAADERRRSLLRLLRLQRAPRLQSLTQSPPQALCHSENQAQFQAALARLPRRQGEVLQLVFYHDMTLAEAAEVMNVSIGSARTHYERAKKALRKQLEDDSNATFPQSANDAGTLLRIETAR